jgi:predicted nucleotidyltransferase
MDLTDQQVRAIKEWAEATRYVQEVRLFGSRAKGDARSNSDADLALTLGGDDPGTILGNYFALSQKWQDELTSRLELKAHVALYNETDDDRVRRYCDKCSIVLFP